MNSTYSLTEINNVSDVLAVVRMRETERERLGGALEGEQIRQSIVSDMVQYTDKNPGKSVPPLGRHIQPLNRRLKHVRLNLLYTLTEVC